MKHLNITQKITVSASFSGFTPMGRSFQELYKQVPHNLRFKFWDDRSYSMVNIKGNFLR